MRGDVCNLLSISWHPRWIDTSGATVSWTAVSANVLWRNWPKKVWYGLIRSLKLHTGKYYQSCMQRPASSRRERNVACRMACNAAWHSLVTSRKSRRFHKCALRCHCVGKSSQIVKHDRQTICILAPMRRMCRLLEWAFRSPLHGQPALARQYHAASAFGCQIWGQDKQHQRWKAHRSEMKPYKLTRQLIAEQNTFILGINTTTAAKKWLVVSYLFANHSFASVGTQLLGIFPTWLTLWNHKLLVGCARRVLFMKSLCRAAVREQCQVAPKVKGVQFATSVQSLDEQILFFLKAFAARYLHLRVKLAVSVQVLYHTRVSGRLKQRILNHDAWCLCGYSAASDMQLTWKIKQ